MTRAARFASLSCMIAVVAACGAAAQSQPGSGGGTARPIAPPPSDDSGEPAATPVAPPSSATATPTSRAYGALAAHNRYRALHCAPEMRWSERIAAEAQRYADQLAANGCAFRHSDSAYGENLMRFSPAGSRTPDYVVEAWYREIADYDFNRPGFAMNTGHFTQVVWAGSTELGCGVAVCNGGETWVCNYAEAGNMRGAFPENVRPTSCR